MEKRRSENRIVVLFAAIGEGAGLSLIGVLLTRGPGIYLPRGTAMEMELLRPLFFQPEEIRFTEGQLRRSLPIDEPERATPWSSSRFEFKLCLACSRRQPERKPRLNSKLSRTHYPTTRILITDVLNPISCDTVSV